MKKLLIFVVVFFILIFSMSADEGVWWGSNYMPGNFVYGGTFSIESDYWGDLSSVPSNGYVAGLGFAPQVEMLLFKPSFASISPIDFGLAVKGRTGFFFRNYLSTVSDPFFPVGIAALGTAHFGFKGFNLHFSDFGDTPTTLFGYLSHLDYFVNFGLALDIIKENSSASFLGFAAATGVNYFVKDNFMLSAGYSYWNGMSGVFIGGSYKMGKGQKTKDINVNIDPFYYKIYLAQFYSLYWYTFYAGGFYSDDSNYKVGQGTEWTLKSDNNSDELLLKKALLKTNSDGSKWWQVKYIDDTDELKYEFLLDKDYKMLKFKFIDEDTGEIREYSPNDASSAEYNKETMVEISDTDYKSWKQGTERISTKAGSFNADHLLYTEDDSKFVHEWWMVNSVPGQIVKFKWKDDTETMTGELTAITKNNKSELDSF